MTETAWDRVHVIGIDDSGPSCLPAAERKLVDAADLLCGGHRHLRLFPDSTAERLPISGNLPDLCRRLQAALGRRRAVVLASGDPGYFGIGPLLAERLGRDRVVIHPRAPSVALAFSRIGMAWQDATVLSVHGRPVEAMFPAARGARKLAILTDPEHTPAIVAKALLNAGMADCPAYVCEHLGGSTEQIHELSLAAVAVGEFEPLNVLILLPTSTSALTPASGRGFGRPDADYASLRGQITKAEVRAVTLARLEPWRATSAWDVGAGAGSVAIEIAGLMQEGTVFAVERDPEQLAVLKDNVRALGASRVQVIAGDAPDALASLPEPDAIFVGGGGSRLGEILRVCARRLRPGGRLVANFARLESLATWQGIATQLGWVHDVVQISVARGAQLGDGTRLAALGPIFVCRLTRSEEQK